MNEKVIQLDSPEDQVNIEPIEITDREIKVVVFKWMIHDEKKYLPEIELFLNENKDIEIISVTSWYGDFFNYTQIIYRDTNGAD